MATLTECAHSGLDIFESPGLQTSIEHAEYVEYRPLSTLDDGPIEFSVVGGSEYLDLSNTFLKVRGKIVLPDGGDLPAARNVVPVNLTLHSLFSDVSMYLNGTQVTTTSGAYPYQAYIQTVLSYGRAAKESHLEASMFYPDTAGHFDAVAGGNNSGMVKRKARGAESKVIGMIGRLHADLFHQCKCLINHVDWRMKLSRNRDNFLLMCDQVAGDYPAYKMVILDCSLFVRKVSVSPSVLLAHSKILEGTNAVYPFTKTVMRVFSAAQGSLNFTLDNLFLERLPNRVVFGFIRTDSYNGVVTRNPYKFEHVNLNFVSLYCHGTQIPTKGLRPNFATQEYTEAYMTLYTGTGTAWSDQSCGIKLSEYDGGYALYCFDLTASMVHSHSAVDPSRPGPLRLECTFSDALEVPYNLVMYAEFAGSVEVTKTREVLVF